MNAFHRHMLSKLKDSPSNGNVNGEIWLRVQALSGEACYHMCTHAQKHLKV